MISRNRSSKLLRDYAINFRRKSPKCASIDRRAWQAVVEVNRRRRGTVTIYFRRKNPRRAVYQQALLIRYRGITDVIALTLCSLTLRDRTGICRVAPEIYDRNNGLGSGCRRYGNTVRYRTDRRPGEDRRTRTKREN